MILDPELRRAAVFGQATRGYSRRGDVSMNRIRLCLLTASLAISFCAQAKETPRPKILQILQVHVLTTDPQQADAFYYGILRTLALSASNETKCTWCEKISTDTNGPIVLESIHGPLPDDLLSAVLLKTDNAEALRKYLEKNKVKVEKWTKWPSGAMFTVFDPEGHRLIFVQAPDSNQPTLPVPGEYVAPSPHWPHIIHAGFVVKDRAAMDHFYKDILGFHVYWQGGMHDGETNWVDMQLPDGTDWIEYMLNVPPNADQRTRGIMNHVAIGVANMKAADQQLLDANLHLPINEPPKIGRDGKWQLNLYDPDGTRVELMEFTPVEKPCCSDFTGPHPQP
jgi:catechol 2,3-dioxygenase-like lactoylglutathione lyase family enzyme